MEEIQVVVFTLGEEQFAIPINFVKEIINFTKVTTVPNANSHVQGMI